MICSLVAAFILLASVETVVLFRLRRKNRERYFQKVQEKFVIIRIFFSDKERR
ncbi:hypothetical protein LEP1GSC185_1481 [Leptospira licerasiae serovar Varillal str. VAR 010]|nr:hypothetical protein LEP1GSC185_1481 [Leptospira licerasiae serovar Varillal str. VAR 010]